MKVWELIEFLKDEEMEAEVRVEATCEYCYKKVGRWLEKHHLDVVDDFHTLLIEIE